MVARVPYIGLRAVAGQVAVGIVSQRLRAERSQAVGGIDADAAHLVRQIDCSEAATHADALASRIVAIAEVAQRAAVGFLADDRESAPGLSFGHATILFNKYQYEIPADSSP